MKYRTFSFDRVMGKFTLNSLLASTLILLFSACGGGSSTPVEEDNNDQQGGSPDPVITYQVSATFFKGPVDGATCELFQTNSGTKSSLIASGITNQEGNVNFGDSIEFEGLVLIECTGGNFQDEMTEEFTSVSTPMMRSVLELSGDSGSEFHVVVSPLTEIATLIAESTAQGLDSILSNESYGQKVSLAFGLEQGTDITSLVPVDLLNNVLQENSPEGKYAYVLSLISFLANSEENPQSLAEVIADMANNLSIEFSSGNSIFSESKRLEIGLAVEHFNGFGSLINSALQATSIRRDVTNDAQFIPPENESTITDSVHQPIELIREELVEFILNNNLQPLPEPPPVSDEMYSLGQALAFDKILSGNKDTSCLTCHHPLLATGDARSLPLGTGGEHLGQSREGGHVIARHAQPLFNLDLFENMFWDGRVQIDAQGQLSTPADATGDITQEMIDVFFAEQAINGFQGFGLVAAQAMFPVADRHEMRGEPGPSNELAAFAPDDFAGIWQALMTRLGAIPEYVSLFENAYPNTQFEDMNFAHAANAIAAFEVKAFNLRNNPWQQVIADVSSDGDLDNPDIFDEDTTRGAHFFFDTGCVNCHSGSVMSDFEFHNIATVQFGPGKGNGDSGFEDWGRELVTGIPGDRAKFRTAPLFNVALSAPYAHLGQFGELWSHIQIYAIPERFWLNLYTGYDRIVGDFVHVPAFENEVSENEKALLKTFPVPSYDGGNHGFFKTLDSIEIQVERAANDPGRLTQETGKRLGDGELGLQRRILLPFMDAQTDPAALNLEHVIPDSVPSGLPVEDSLSN